VTAEFLGRLKEEQSEELEALKRPPAHSESAPSLAYVMNALAIGDPLTPEEHDLLSAGQKMASAAEAALPDGQANVMLNLQAKDLQPAAGIAGAREVTAKLLSAVLDIVTGKSNPLAQNLEAALAPLQVRAPGDRKLAQLAIRVATGLVAKAGNCDEFARIAATTDVGNLITRVAGGTTPFSHKWAVVEDAAGHRMNVDP
jgi:hypothetical protein